MNMLKGDWYSDKSRTGKGQGWRCRKCGVWVPADQPLTCDCTAKGVESDAAKLKRLQRELDNLREHNAKLEALFIDVVEEYMTKEDGKCVGPLSVRVNMMTGRV